MPPAAPRPAVFRSTAHPGDCPAPLVFARAFAAPLLLATAAAMTAGTAAALSGAPALAWFAAVLVLGAALATAATAARLRTTAAELLVWPGHAAVRTVWDVATGAPAVPLPLLPPRTSRDGLRVALGTDVRTFRNEDWPDGPTLRAALTAAALDPP